MRLGVFGGTFDPIHLAHLRVAEEVAEALRLDQVLFVPAGVPPHRGRPLATPAQRLAMVHLAVAGNPRFAVSDLEIRKRTRAYTVDTLAEVKRHRPGAQLYFLLGFDQLAELPRWHDPERLVKLCRLAAFSRPGQVLAHGRAFPGRLAARVTRVRVSALDISATLVRRRVRQRQSLRYLVPEPVRKYIGQHRLYRP